MAEDVDVIVRRANLAGYYAGFISCSVVSHESRTIAHRFESNADAENFLFAIGEQLGRIDPADECVVLQKV